VGGSHPTERGACGRVPPKKIKKSRCVLLVACCLKILQESICKAARHSLGDPGLTPAARSCGSAWMPGRCVLFNKDLTNTDEARSVLPDPRSLSCPELVHPSETRDQSAIARRLIS